MSRAQHDPIVHRAHPRGGAIVHRAPLAVLAGILVACALGVGAGAASVAGAGAVPGCTPVRPDTAGGWSVLLAEGWHGHAGDGAEQLYRPGC